MRLAGRLGESMVRMREAALAGFLLQQGVTVGLGEYLDQFAEFVPFLIGCVCAI